MIPRRRCLLGNTDTLLTHGIAEKVRKGVIRYAPSFIPGVCASIGDAHPYTIEALDLSSRITT